MSLNTQFQGCSVFHASTARTQTSAPARMRHAWYRDCTCISTAVSSCGSLRLWLRGLLITLFPLLGLCRTAHLSLQKTRLLDNPLHPMPLVEGSSMRPCIRLYLLDKVVNRFLARIPVSSSCCQLLGPNGTFPTQRRLSSLRRVRCR